MSALIGSPPATTNDYWIVRALYMFQGKVPSNASVEQGILIPPSRPTDYHYATNTGAIIAGSVIALLIMATITGLRLYLRWTQRGGRWGTDDWVIIPGLMLALVVPCLNVYGAAAGTYGRHIWDNTYHQFDVFNWTTDLTQLFFFMAVSVVKMSITFFNMRLTSLTSRKWKIFHWTFFAALVVYFLAVIFMFMFQCNPPGGNFDLIEAGHRNKTNVCMSNASVTAILSGPHALMDLMLLAIPITVLWKVKMGVNAKIRLYLLFSIGSMSLIGSIMRQTAVAKVEGVALDPTWRNTPVLVWTLVDLTFGVSAASLPMLSTLLPRAWRGSSRNNGGTGYPSRGATATIITTIGASKNSHFKTLQSHDESGIRVQDEIELTYHAAEPGRTHVGTGSETDEESRKDKADQLRFAAYGVPEDMDDGSEGERPGRRLESK